MSARTRLFAGPAHGPTHRSAPTDSNAAFINPWKPGRDRAPPLQSTNAQCRFEIYQALIALVFRKAGTWNDSRHQSLPLPSPVPTSFVPESPVPFGMVSKGRAAALPLVVSRGLSGGKFEIPPDNLSWGARGDILLIRKEYPFASRRPSSAALPPTRAGISGGTPYLGHGLRRPNSVPEFGASVKSSYPTKFRRSEPSRPLIDALNPGCYPSKRSI